MKRIIILFILFLLMLIQAGFGEMQKDRPLKGQWDFHMEIAWELDTIDGSVFANIRAMEITPNGNLLVMDESNFKVYIISPEGKLIASFGKKGEGPGEVRMMRRMLVTENSIIIPERGRLNYFSHNGQFKKIVTLPSQLYPQDFIDDHRMISAPRHVPPGTETSEIILYDLNTKNRLPIAKYEPFKKSGAEGETNGARMRLVMIFGGITPLMTLHHAGGKLYYGMNDRYDISVVDIKGKSLGRFGITERKPRPVSREYKNGMFRNSRFPQDMVDRIIKNLPDKAVYFGRIETRKNGLIYVFVADPEAETRADIDIFSPSYRYLYSASLRVPDIDSFRFLRFDESFLYMLVENEDGDLLVTKYRITHPTL